MHADNLKNNTALLKRKLDHPLYLGENRLYFKHSPTPLKGTELYLTLLNMTSVMEGLS
jgi:hypothetical protein